LLLQNGHGDDVLRLSLVPAGATLHTVMVTRARGPRVRCVRLLPTVVEPPRGHRGDLKLWPRPFYDAVRQQAQDGGADDGIVVAPDGAVRETAIANLWLRLDGVWVTPALDGQVLPGIARALLLQTASVRGREVRQRRCDLADLHRAEALACSNATSGPRPAALLSAEATVVAASERLVAGELLTLWRDTVAD
jgi:para-aminobenzoate synthetase/4-amino-4-deoxychorismate lyase